MRILLLAPHPLYQNRGTPIATSLLLEALSKLGKVVDVVTYHEGESLAYPGVTFHRILNLPIRGIRPGFSFKKVFCDIFILMKALLLCSKRRYAVVHCIEESVFIGMLLKVFFRVPYIYDMDSSLVQQMIEAYPVLKRLRPAMNVFERAAVRGACLVVPVCDTLAEVAKNYGAKRVVVLRDVSLLTAGTSAASNGYRKGLADASPLVMYVGNLEPYQGIEMLLQSFALARRAHPQARLMIVGGAEQRIRQYQVEVKRLKLEDHVSFTGPKSVKELGGLLAQADILVSPRIRGRNTPMKLYSYLHSGRPVLATNLLSHTQVLSAEVSVLTAPFARAYADGMERLMRDRALRERLGRAGRRLVEERHNFEAFSKTVDRIYDGFVAEDGL